MKRNFSKESRMKIIESNKNRVYSDETRSKISKGNKGKIPWNKGRTNVYGKETKRKMSERKRYVLKDYQNKYPFFCTIEELRECPETGRIQARCKNHNCENSKEDGGWFTPTGAQLSERNKSINYENENGACYLYCSEECKNSCDLFGKSAAQIMKQDQISAGLIVDLGTEGTEIWRQEVFKRNINEHGKLQCEICGNSNKNELSAHHEKPQKTNPEMALDPDNGWVLCSFGKGNDCHLKHGHPKNTNCSTGELAKLVCKRNI